MTDESLPTSPEPVVPGSGSPIEREGPTDRLAIGLGATPAAGAAFSGRTKHKSEALRAGVMAGTGLVVALGAAVAMGASPAPSSNATGTAPGASAVPTAGTGTAPDTFGPGDLGPGDLGPGDLGRGGPGKGDGRVFGRVSVTAVAGSELSLATEDGWTRTIRVTDATTITRGGAAATLADIAVGDELRFRQTRNADGSYTINAIAIVLPHTAGTVTGVDADSITITLRDGTSQTITTTATTTYRIGRSDGTRADVAVGSQIAAIGEQDGTGPLTATTVVVRLPHVAGAVSAVTTDSLTITRRDGTTVTVHVDADTTIRVAGSDNATIADVKSGMVAVIEGTQRADGSFDARELHAGDPGARGGGRGWLEHGPGPDGVPAPDAGSGTDG